MTPNPNQSRPHSDDPEWIVSDDHSRPSGDVAMRDDTSSRGGGRGDGPTTGSRAGELAPARHQFEANSYLGIFICGCRVCVAYRDHVINEGGNNNNPLVEAAKRRLGELLVGAFKSQDEKLRKELAEAKRDADDKATEIAQLQRKLKDSREETSSAQRELERERARARADPPTSTNTFSGSSQGARYRDEPHWGYRSRDRSPQRKRELPEDIRQDSHYEPPRRQARDDRYDGRRYDRRDIRRRDDWRDDRPRSYRERTPTGNNSWGTAGPSSYQGRQRRPFPDPDRYYYGPSGYDGLLDDNSEYEASSDSDTPRKAFNKVAKRLRANADIGSGLPYRIPPPVTDEPEALSFLGDRIRFAEAMHPKFQPVDNNKKHPAQIKYDDLFDRENEAARVAVSKRTPFQQAIAPFCTLPRVPGVKSSNHRRPPSEGDGLDYHLIYAIREPSVQPRGIYVFDVPGRPGEHAVSIAQVRSLVTIRRMMPFHNDVFSPAAANDHFEFLTDFAEALIRISLVPPPGSPMSGGGYMAYRLHLQLPLNENAPRVLRRWNRQSDGAISPSSVTRFLVSSGISSTEYNDMMPFALQVLWDSVVYGIRGDETSALYLQYVETLIGHQGEWPSGLPGPTIFTGNAEPDLALHFTQPRLPGEGQPLIRYGGPVNGLDTSIADPNHDLRRLKADDAKKLGWASGLPISPWPAPPASTATTAATTLATQADQPVDTEMEDAQASTSAAAGEQMTVTSSTTVSDIAPESSSSTAPATVPAASTSSSDNVASLPSEPAPMDIAEDGATGSAVKADDDNGKKVAPPSSDPAE